MKRKKYAWLNFLLLVAILGNLGFRAYSYRENYRLPFDSEYWKGRYLRSQWVDPLSTESIGDDGLYAHVGWEYAHGRDPTTLQSETPPLGKYLIGLSEIVFRNQNIFALISGLAVLVALYKVVFLLFSNRLWALLLAAAFSLEPLFFTQLRAPFLDNLYLFFLLLTFYFFLKGNLLRSFVFLGLFTATKSPFLGLFVFVSLFLTFVLTKGKRRLKSWLLSAPLSFLSYALVYFRFFQLGGSLREFLGVQKWILSFYLSSGLKVKKGMVWTMIFLNKWQVWWAEEVLKISSWNFSWPILGLAPFIVLVMVLFKGNKKMLKLNPGILLILIWVFVYLLFLSFVPVWPRYFLLLLPFEYLLVVYLFQTFLKWKSDKIEKEDDEKEREQR